MSHRRSTAALAAAVLVLTTVLTGCQMAKAGAKCRPGSEPARDKTHVLFCQGGRWKRVMTIGQAANFIVSSWPANVEAVWGGDQSAPIDTKFGGLRVRVTKRDGSPAAGADVTFSGAGIATGTARTGSDGIADFVPTASGMAGTNEVVAKVSGGFSPQASFWITTLPGAPVGVAVASGAGQSAAAGTAFGAPVVLRATDRFGNGVWGQQIDVATQGGGTWFAPSSVWTGENGQGSTTATAGNVAGTSTVVATLVSTGATTSFPLTVTAGPVVNVTPGSGNGESAAVNTRFSNGFVAALSDLFGNPTPGIPVQFAVIGGGGGASATLDSATVLTDASGLAINHATANGISGSYQITATYGATTLTFNVTNT